MKARRTTGQPRAPWPLAKTLKAIDDAWEGKSSKRLNVVVGLIRSAYGLDSVVLYLVRRNARFLVQQAHTGKPTFVRESKCLLHSKRPRLENSEHRFSKVIRERNPHYENPEAKSGGRNYCETLFPIWSPNDQRNCLGLLVICSSSGLGSLRIAEVDILAKHLALLLAFQQIATFERFYAQSHAEFINRIGLITSSREVLGRKTSFTEIAVKIRPQLQRLLKGWASHFDASCCGLFLADKGPILTTNGRLKIQIDSDADGPGFTLRACFGYQRSHLDHYSILLTSNLCICQVLKTCKPFFTRNVVSCKYFSEEHSNTEIENGHRKESSWRAWMGVPLLVRETDGPIKKEYLLGALTFVRHRNSLDDNLFFRKQDISIAAKLADLLAQSLYSRSFGSRVVEESQKQLIQYFLHDGSKSNEVIRQHVLPRLSEIAQAFPEETAAELNRIHIDLDQAVSYQESQFRGYGIVTGKVPNPKWEKGDSVSMKDLTRSVWGMIGHSSIKFDIDGDAVCRVDREKLTLVLGILLDNAVDACTEYAAAFQVNEDLWQGPACGKRTTDESVRKACQQRCITTEKFEQMAKLWAGCNPTLRPPRISVKLSCQEKDQRPTVKWEIVDNGIGFKKEDSSRIFEQRFTTKTTQSGLGLYIARRLSELAGGDLSGESELGQYAKFSLTIPLTE